MNTMKVDKSDKQAGYMIAPRGRPVAAGDVCKCPAVFCPAHGRLDKAELRRGRRVRGQQLTFRNRSRVHGDKPMTTHRGREGAA
jgi:hypothetical protein